MSTGDVGSSFKWRNCRLRDVKMADRSQRLEAG
jgi:hypothetical protein